jgi:exo beta-1,2-glucooligosaccharide sophorohydrolase (non-reducing end)
MLGLCTAVVASCLLFASATDRPPFSLEDTITAPHAQAEPLREWFFFENSTMPGSFNFGTPTVRGNSTVRTVDGRLPVSSEVFFTPHSSLIFDCKNGDSGHWLVDIERQYVRGQDLLKKADRLFFHLNLQRPVESAQLPTLALEDEDGKRSAAVQIGPYVATNRVGEWQEVSIPIRELLGKDETSVNPYPYNHVRFEQGVSDGSTLNFYVDDLGLLPNPGTVAPLTAPALTSATGYLKHIDLEWDPISNPFVRYVKVYRQQGRDFVPIGIQVPSIHRYADFTGKTGETFTYKISLIDTNYQETLLSNPISASTKPMSDDELLTMVQEACFRYYWEGAEPNSGLARENILGRQNMIACGASGFGMMALLVGTERQFVTREQAIARFLRITDFLEKADRFHGVWPHFMDGPTGKVEPFFGKVDDGADLVETSFLVQGLLAARNYFDRDTPDEKMIRDHITRLWEGVQWDWHRREPDGKYLIWHWSPDHGWAIDHHLIGWNETMITYLMSIFSPTHAVPASMYYTGWASQEKRAQDYRHWSQTDDGQMYSNGNTYFGHKLAVGVSTGGPLFFTHYSYMGMDPHYLNDIYTNYFDNNKTIAEINLAYCTANPKHQKGYGANAWGLTASDSPHDYSADEPVEHQDMGKLTPTGPIASFPYTPDASMAALKHFYEDCGSYLWGEYGFRDSFDLNQNWCSPIYMGLNQAPMVVMIENYRTGLIWKTFMKDPDVRKGLEKLDAETAKRK